MLRFIDPMVRLITLAILAASVFPAHGEGREVAQFVSNVAIFVLFFLYGLRLSRGEVLAGLGNHRLLIPLVAWVFLAMTAAGWVLWKFGASGMAPQLAIGFLYLGVLPSTVQSATAYSSMAGGNIASSVVAAALINILGVFISAPLFSALAGSAGAPFHGETLIKVLTVLVLPFIIGQFLQKWARNWVKGHGRLVTWMDRSSIAIAVYVAFSAAVDQGIWSELDFTCWAWMIGGCAAMLMFGYGGSWLLGGALSLPRPDRISMLFAGAQKSVAMGAPLAMVLFPPTKAGIILLPLVVYHLVQMLLAAPLAGRLRAHS